MHYAVHLAFASVEHIMRDVRGGVALRYIHANGASMFFIVAYLRKIYRFTSNKSKTVLISTVMMSEVPPKVSGGIYSTI